MRLYKCNGHKIRSIGTSAKALTQLYNRLGHAFREAEYSAIFEFSSILLH